MKVKACGPKKSAKSSLKGVVKAKAKSALKGVTKAKVKKYVRWPVVRDLQTQTREVEAVEGERGQFHKLSGDAVVKALEEVNRFKLLEMDFHPASRLNNHIHFTGRGDQRNMNRREKVKKANKLLAEYDWMAVEEARQEEEEAALKAAQEKEMKKREAAAKAVAANEEKVEEEEQLVEEQMEEEKEEMCSQAPDVSELDTAFVEGEEVEEEEEEMPCSQAPGENELDTAFFEE
jgi:hypothetical protein